MPQLCLLPAGAPELVRSNQKDRFYINRITAFLADISRQVLPLRLWLKWQRELQLLAELGYYGLTTVIDNQTLGEEYTNTIQVRTQSSPDSFSRPLYTPVGIVRRSAAIGIQAIGPYAIEKALEVIYKRIIDRNFTSPHLTEQQYEVLERIVGFVEELVVTCNRIHLALFYLWGIFYHFGKRFSGIRYVMVRYSVENPNIQSAPLSTYRILGWIIMVQLMFKALKWLWDYFKSKQRQSTQSLVNTDSKNCASSSSAYSGPRVILESQQIPSGEDEYVHTSSSLKCPLCLEMCKAQTTTLCGHVFCWKCVNEWVSEKSECPICRSGVEPQQLVCLQRFEC